MLERVSFYLDKLEGFGESVFLNSDWIFTLKVGWVVSTGEWSGHRWVRGEGGGILKAMLGQEGNQGAMMLACSIIGLMLCQREVNVIYISNQIHPLSEKLS